jgi:hypothetical protein
VLDVFQREELVDWEELEAALEDPGCGRVSVAVMLKQADTT